MKLKLFLKSIKHCHWNICNTHQISGVMSRSAKHTCCSFKLLEWFSCVHLFWKLQIFHPMASIHLLNLLNPFCCHGDSLFINFNVQVQRLVQYFLLSLAGCQISEGTKKRAKLSYCPSFCDDIIIFKWLCWVCTRLTTSTPGVICTVFVRSKIFILKIKKKTF